MRVRLDPIDEYTHELGPEPTFNESMYFNLYDAKADWGGFFRIGNRPNEGTGEMTVCLYLPDGRVAFMFQRPEVRDNSAFNSAGLRFDVVEPFEHLTVTYRGKVVVLDDPLVLRDPRVAFREHPWVDAEAQLTFMRVSDMFGGEPEVSDEREGEEFAKGHYEQLVRGTGTVRVGEHTWTVDGHGLRDHSWGPRTWQAPWYYRWLTANIGPDAGFMLSRIARPDRDGSRNGFVWDEGRLWLCDQATIATEWDTDHHQRRITATLGSSHHGGRTWTIEGEVLRVVPLRNRRDGRVTRIAEGLTRWTLDGTRVGYGWSEYLDQIVDDVPVGLAE
jgi:hypothetical protein